MTGLIQLFSSDWAHSLGWTLLHSLWEIALVTLAVALLMAALRRRSANARYLVATVGLLATVALPVVTYCVVPPRVESTIVDPIAAPDVEESTLPPSASTQDALPAIVDMLPVSDEAPDIEAVASVPSAPADKTPLALPPEQSQIAETSTPQLARVTQAFAPCVPWLAIVWLLGVWSLSVWNLGGWIAALRLRHLATTPVGGPLTDRLAELARRMRVSLPVQMVQSRLVDVPIVVGWLRPAILMPVGILTGFSPAQLDAILAHELAHIRRHDYLINLFQTLAETLLFYHPGVWWISRRIRIEREHCCDDAAVAVCGSNVAYAAALTALEESLAAPRPALAANEGNTLTRVRRILGAPVQRGQLTRPLAGSLAALAIIGTAACLLWSDQHLNSALATEGNESVPFVKARIAQYFDANGRKLTVDDAATIEQLTAFLPDVGKGKESDIAAGWESSAVIQFDCKDKSTLRVATDFDDWSEGHGDWPVRGDLAGFIEKRFADALLKARRKAAEQAIRLKSAADDGIAAGQQTTGLDLSVLLDLTGQRADADRFTDDHRFFDRDTKRLAQQRRTWALCSLLDHENVDAKIYAARSLLQLADPESVPVLLAAAKRNNYPVSGSESATLHSIYRSTLKEALEKITGEQLTPAGLRVTSYPKPGEPKVIRSEDDPSFFREAVDFDKVERWLSARGVNTGAMPREDTLAALAAAADRIVLIEKKPGKPAAVVRAFKGSTEVGGGHDRFERLLSAHPEDLEGPRWIMFLRETSGDSWLGLKPATDDPHRWLIAADPAATARVEKVIPLPDEWSKPVNGVSLGVRARSGQITTANELILEVALKSSRPVDVWNHRYNIYDYWPFTTFEVTAPSGKRFLVAKPEGVFREDDYPGRCTLAPDKPYVHAIHLYDWAVYRPDETPHWKHDRAERIAEVAKAFAEPGKYTFRAIYESKHKRGDADFIGRLVSPPVTVQREINVAAKNNSSADGASPPEEIWGASEEPVEQVLMKTYDVGGLDVEAGFVPDANSIMLRQPSFVTFRVTNRSGKPYQFDIGGDNRGSVRHNKFRITAVDAAGRAVRDPYSYRHFGGMGRLITLAPGETHSERLYLGHWLEFERTGQYTVTCERTLEKHGRGPRHPPLAVSSHFTMMVTSQDAVAMAAVIARLGEQVREGNAATLREATIALADVEDVRVIPHLAASVTRGDDQNKIPAIKCLGRYGNDAAVEALRVALDDDDDAVRSAAGQALQKADKGDQVARQLLKQLASDSANVRRLAAQALGQTGSEAAIEPLIAALNDPTSPVRCAAAVSLGELGRGEAADPLRQSLKRDDRALRVAAAGGLRRLTGRFDPKWVTATIRETTDINDRTFHESIRLTRIYAGGDAVAALIGCLRFDDPSPRGSYNFRLILAIHHCKDGPDCYYRWKHDPNRSGTKEEIENNRKILDELKQFAAEAAGDDEIDARPAANESTERIQETAEAGPNVDTSLTGNPRQRFLEIERVARLPKAEQAQAEQLKRFYTELAPRYMNPIVTGILSSYPRHILNRADTKHYDGTPERWAQQLEDAAKNMSPEEVADNLEIGLWLNIAAQARAMQVFRRHEKAVAAMIEADLATRGKAQVGRAAATVSTLGLHAFTDELLDLLLANGEASEAAHDALLFMRDPDIAEPLLEHVAKDPSSLARCAGLLEGPFYGQAADPLLLGLLETPDKKLRYHAVRAVYECRDPKLAPFVAEFARDDETRFRVAAAYMTKNLPDESFKAVRAQLLPLLGDKDESVRFEALRSFGLKRDLAAGPVILETLRREQFGGRFLLHVMHALDALAGETFGYNMHNWGPASQRNRAAIEEFEKWLNSAEPPDGFAADLVEELTGVVTDEEGQPLEGVIVKMCGVEWFHEGRWRRNRRLACYFPRPPVSDKAGRFTVQFNEGLFELPFDEKTTRVNFWFDKEGFAPTYLSGMSPRPDDVKVIMKRGIRVSGTVKRLADEKLAPAPAAVVSLQCLSGDLAQQKRFFDDPLSTMKDTTGVCDLPYRKRVSTDVEGRYTFRLSPPPDDKKWCLFCSGQAVMLDVKERGPTQGPDFVVKDEVSETDGAEDEAGGLGLSGRLVADDQEKPSDWGEPVEGIQCRLQAGKTKCDVGQPVELRAEIRSTEASEGKWLRPTDPSSRCKVEVDGRWYGWVGQVRARPFPPAAVTKQVESLNVQVDWGWRTDAGEMLKLAPGRHTIRVAFAPFREGEAGGRAIRVISNPVEVEVAEPDPRDPAPQAPWGEAVVGVQSRLRAEQVMWKAGEIPTLKADVRNRGEGDLAVAQAQQLCELEIDGRWYRWVGPFALKSSWFPPGRQYNDIPITLGKNWQSKIDKKPISLAPGKHVVRVAVIARTPDPKRDGAPPPVRAVSNPVEIEVVESDPKDPAPRASWGEAVEGVRLRLRPDATVWKVGQTPTFKIDVRNDGTKSWRLLRATVRYGIEVDGRWYRWNGTIGVVTPPTGPGEKLTVAFRADGTILKHVERAKVTSLEFSPGRHTIRVGCSPASAEGMKRIRLVSNPVEIEVVAIDPKDVAPSGEAVEHDSDTAELKLLRGENAVTSATVREGQNAAEILNALGRPDYVDDDPWYSYKASPEGGYVLLFEEQVSKTDAKPDLASVTLWGVRGPGTDAGKEVFLLPRRLRGEACGDFIALRVRAGPGLKKVATVALGMSSSDVLRLFRLARDLAAKEGYILCPSIDDGEFLLVFSARDDNKSDDSAGDRLSEVIYRPGGHEKPIYLLPFKKRGHAIPAVHKALLDNDQSRRNRNEGGATAVGTTGGVEASEHHGRISGVVVDRREAPVAGAAVVLCRQATGVPFAKEARQTVAEVSLGGSQPTNFAYALTDEQGRFSFDKIPVGEYRLVAQSWPDADPIEGLMEVHGEVLRLHGSVEQLKVTAESSPEAVIRPLGTGVLRMDEDMPNDWTVLALSTAAPRADPALGFVGWGGPFMHNLIGGTRMPAGKITVHGLPEGKLYIALFANDNRPGFGAKQVDIQAGKITDAYVPIVADWSNGHREPPKRLVPLFEEVRLLMLEKDKSVAGLLEGHGIRLKAGGILQSQQQISQHLSDEIKLPTGRKTTFADFMAAVRYVELQQSQSTDNR